MVAGSRRLRWEEHAGVHSCDLSGHFWAEARRVADGHWAYIVWDYQNNEMLSGVAIDVESAQDAVESWDVTVVEGGDDPSREWADESP